MVPLRLAAYAVAMSTPGTRAPVQVFGRDDSQATRSALRFFKERRVAVSYVDLRARPIAPGELRRFVERLGAPACADVAGKAWRDAGLGYLRMDDAELAGRLLADQRLLRLPLCRDGNAVTAGPAEATWRTWVAGDAAGSGR
jgi:arsenate reductase-like glutaredoxin family protein